MKKLFLSFVMLMSCCMMFSQNEFEYIYEDGESNYHKVIYFSNIFEMDNGDYMLFGRKFGSNYFGRFSNSGELLAETLINDSVPGYESWNGEGTPVIKSKDGPEFF